MAKYLDGRRYDPSTSTLLVVVDNGLPKRELKFEQYAFYRKKTGEVYAIRTGLVWSVDSSSRHGQRDEKYIVHTDTSAWADAVAFLEARGDADDYESVFGVDENTSKAQISAWVPSAVKERADALDATIAEIFAAGVEALTAKKEEER
jgi:hypothetical protein